MSLWALSVACWLWVISVLSMLVVPFMSLPPKGRKRGGPNGPTPLSGSRCRSLGAVHSAAVVFAGGETRRAGPPPPVGRDDPARWRLFDCHWWPIKPPRLTPPRFGQRTWVTAGSPVAATGL